VQDRNKEFEKMKFQQRGHESEDPSTPDTLLWCRFADRWPGG
jgi:hypothetical protein